jgi:xylulokinase
MTLFIGADLGTSGCKTALFDSDGTIVASAFSGYRTHYPQDGWHEQSPEDWWEAVTSSIRQVLAQVSHRRSEVVGIGLSGQSLTPIPVDEVGTILTPRVPIWSDSRATEECRLYFQGQDEELWYQRTGNGFPAHLYTIFKVMWMRNHQPDEFKRTKMILGSKDWINYKLTGQVQTDHSYAAGSGIYDLLKRCYSPELVDNSGLDISLFPNIVESSAVIGKLLPDIAQQLGLDSNVSVVCGGVDNSCMALGAQNTEPGRIYASLGSSSWLTICDDRPILESALRPFVFPHVIPGLFNSAVSTFGAGTSVAWVMEAVFPQFNGNIDLLVELAAEASVGSNGLVFVPSLAGGTVFEGGSNLKGSFSGLSVGHTREHLARAVIEGIPLALRRPLDELRKITSVNSRMVVTGGGSKNETWLQIYSDILNCQLLKTNIEENAATLGAVTLVGVGLGYWKDYTQANLAHNNLNEYKPNIVNADLYTSTVLPRFAHSFRQAAELAELPI